MSAGSEIRIPIPMLRRFGIGALVTLWVCGLCAEIGHALGADNPLRPFFSLSYETNLPTWFSSGLLLMCAVCLALIGRAKADGGARFANHWLGLAAIFAYISLDEFVSIHEHMNAWFDLGGFLYFGWVIPAGLAVGVLGLVYLPFLLHLPEPTRRQVVLAGMFYVGGALGVELILGWWTDRAGGDDGLGYALIDFVEESCELFGAALFLDALLGSMLAGGGTLRLVGAEEQPDGAEVAPGARAHAQG